MDCGSVKTKLIDLVYGELPPAEDQALRQHCQSCPGCAQELAALTETLELTRRVPEPELPPFLNTRVLAHAREQAAVKKQPAGRWAWLLRPQVTMAAVAMIAASIVIVVVAERGPLPPKKGPYLPLTEQQMQEALKQRPKSETSGGAAPAEMFESEGSATPAEPPLPEAAPAAPEAAPVPAPPPRTSAETESNRAEDRLLPAEARPDQERMRETARAQAQAGTAGPAAPRMADASAAPVTPPASGGGAAISPPSGSVAQGGQANAPAAPAGLAQPLPPKPAAPAPAPAPAAVPSRSADNGSLGFHAKSIAAGEAAPSDSSLAAPAPPASAPVPAPPAPPAGSSELKAKAEEADEAAAANAQPPSPAQLVATARALEKDGKYAEALAAYQSALAGLSYAPGKGKDQQPTCSPLLKQALNGAGRCQAKLGKKAEADATAAALKSICK